MTRARDIADLVDANGDIVAGALDNVPASNDASALTTGTLDAARLPTEIVSSDTTPQLGGNLDLNSNSITGSGAINVSGSIQATGNAITVEDSGFNSRINLKNTGTGGTEFSLYSTMNSFAQGAETFMLYSANATGGIIKADKYGRVTMPYQPSFRAVGNNSTYNSISSLGGAGTYIPFSTVTTNIGSHYNNSTYKFTAPVSGMYHFSYNIYTRTGTPTEDVYARWTVNNTAYRGYTYFYNTTGSEIHHTLTDSMSTYLNANDFIGVTINGNGNSDIYLGNNEAIFSGFLIG